MTSKSCAMEKTPTCENSNFIIVTNANIGHGHMMNEVYSHGFPPMTS